MISRSILIATCALAVSAAAALGAQKGPPPQDMPYLIDMLKSEDVQERRSTAQTLGTMGYDIATPALCEALNDRDVKVQMYAAEALGKIGDKKAVDALIAKLPGSELIVKRFVLGALGKIKDTRALEPLTKALGEEIDGDVRASAAYGLGELGDPAATEALVVALSDDYKWVRYETCGALARVGAVGALAALRAVAANDKDEQVRAAAAKAVATLESK